MILKPNAKINIGLNILFKRSDGFHELETLMYPVPLTDIITINKGTSNKDKILFSSTGIPIDGESANNLIVKAYNLLNSEFNLPHLNIHLHKSIPFGAGLGGGSADCAYTIKGINDFCKLGLSSIEMETFAAKLGSDCPFFIKNKPAIAKGRGEILYSSTINLDEFYIALIIPPVPISTKKAYALVKPFTPNIVLKDLLKEPISNWKNLIVNNFEDSVFLQYPEIGRIKNKLYEIGAEYASLSGSGSAVFGIFKNIPFLKNIFPKNYFTWISCV